MLIRDNYFILDIIHGDQSKKYYVDDTVGADFGDDDEIAEEVVWYFLICEARFGKNPWYKLITASNILSIV